MFYISWQYMDHTVVLRQLKLVVITTVLIAALISYLELSLTVAVKNLKRSFQKDFEKITYSSKVSQPPAHFLF